MAGLRTVGLNEELCSAAEKKFGERFATVDDLLNAVLLELLRGDSAELDEREQRIIEERLRGLGYV